MVVRTLGLLVLRRVLGLLNCGHAPDAKDVEIAVAGVTRKAGQRSRGSSFANAISDHLRDCHAVAS